ncbi:Pectate lyase [Alteromonadaceae bacterium Bs31]|nr:Pectate lyase [Alteromonadaceae bacterium Bs31]
MLRCKTMVLLSSMLALAACGGGGSGGTNTSPDVTPTNTPSEQPSPQPTPEQITLSIEESSSALLSVFPDSAYQGTINGYTVLQGLSNDTSTSPASSAYLNYSVNVGTRGDYQLRIHYAFGGTETNIRDSWVYVNGLKVQIDDDEILEFDYTGTSDGKWNTYAYTAPITISLDAGDNDIRLVALNTPDYTRTITFTRGNVGATGAGTMKGLPNIESLEISGEAPITEGTGSTVLYTLTTGIKDGEGEISLSLEQDFYLPQTTVTLNATAAPDFKFDAWTGDAPSTDSSYSFVMEGNLKLEARFIPSDAAQPAGLIGFGAVQSDTAIPYTLTGGHGAELTSVSTLSELRSALENDGPLLIKVSGHIDNSANPSESLNVPSNTTLYGDPDNQGHLQNIELKLSGENYIIRNLILSEVVSVAIKDDAGTTLVEDGSGNDVISINGGRHVWIDHCELYSSLKPAALYDIGGANDSGPDNTVNEYDAKEFYDGLIDIKNSAAFITLSNNYIHDHWKGILIGSSDNQENGDSATRITLHHNHFKDIVSRIPSLRYGKGHFYNNYVQGTLPSLFGKTVRVDTIFNVRQGAEALIEGNYIEGAEDTFGYFHSGGSTGFWNVSDNSFVDVLNPVDTSTGDYTVPYTYNAEASSGIKASLPPTVGVGILTSTDLP